MTLSLTTPGSTEKMSNRLYGGSSAPRLSARALASVFLLVLISSSTLVTAQPDPQQQIGGGDLELCPTTCACPTCACPVPTPAGGDAGQGADAAVTAGSGIVVTRQKCDPNDVETCKANW